MIDFSNKSTNTNALAVDVSLGKKSGNESNNTQPRCYDRMDLSKSFAQLSLPSLLQLEETDSVHGLCIITKQKVASLTQFGPLEGESILEKDVPEDFRMKDLWQVFTDDHRKLYFSTVNPEKSNWLRYLRPATNRKQRNVAAIVKRDRLYFVTTRDLVEGEELLYWIDDPDLMWTKKRADKKSKDDPFYYYCEKGEL